VNITAEDFRKHYADLSDGALLEIEPRELVAVAQVCLAEELARRGLDAGMEADLKDHPPTEAEGDKAQEEEFICIVEYDHHDEADFARGLLEGSEIPSRLESEPGVVRLMVPGTLAEQALQMLAAPLTDEELAEQAEAAGQDLDQDSEEDQDS
jgi:hypothetical protein